MPLRALFFYFSILDNPLMMKWILLVLGAITLLGIGLWTYGPLSSQSVVVATPLRREAVRAVYATGTVRAEQIARLRPELGGEVTSVAVREGLEIRQGELVMEIAVRDQELQDVREGSARVAEAQLRVREAKANLDREQALFDTGASTQQAVDDKRGVYSQSLAYLRTVQALSSRRSTAGRGRIEAPITGVVTRVNVNVGDMLPPNTDAVTIIDPSSFKVYAEIDELDINSVRPGQEAVVSFDANPGARYKARVERIVPQADEERKTLPVVLYLGDYIPNLSDGLSATVNIVQERRPNALTIPSAAIIDQSNGFARVFVVGRNDVLELRKVRMGIRGEEFIEVLEGVQEDDRVVIDPQEGWEAGMSVDVATPKAATRRSSEKGA